MQIPSVGALVASTRGPVAASAVAAAALPLHLDPGSLIATERSVHVGFDVFSVDRGYAGLIEHHGSDLASMPALTACGVKDRQMDAVSWGKERPKAMGHDETDCAENRRADRVDPKP